MKLRLGILAVTVCLFLAGTSAMAAPVLGGGWTYDQIDAAATPTEGSPYLYSFGGPVMFRITDQFNPGDTYSVFDFGTLILTTSFDGAQASISPIGDPNGDAGWTSASYSHGAVLLGAGLHSIVVEGDGVGGVPAGLYDRIDSSVPEPSTFLLLGLGLATMAVVSFRSKVSNN